MSWPSPIWIAAGAAAPPVSSCLCRASSWSLQGPYGSSLAKHWPHIINDACVCIYVYIYIQGYHQWMVYREYPIEMDDLGVPLFQEIHMCIYVYIYVYIHIHIHTCNINSMHLYDFVWLYDQTIWAPDGCCGCCGNHGWPHAIVIEGIARTFGGSSLSRADQVDQVDFFTLVFDMSNSRKLNRKATKSYKINIQI